MFVHLHSHSYYSFLEGVPSPQQLAQTAAQQKMPAIALTDHRGMSGAIEFYDACHEAGILPILGLEIEISLPANMPGFSQSITSGSLVLLAEDLSGWSNLCRLSSTALNDPTSAVETPLPFDTLARNSGGLICLTGGIRGLVAKLISAGSEETSKHWLEHLNELFPNRLYVELQRHTPEDDQINFRLIELAQRMGVPAVASHNIYYLNPEQAGLQRALTAIRLNQSLSSLEDDSTAPPEAFFQSQKDMEARFLHYPQTLAATLEVADRCQVELPLGVPHFPEIPLPEGKTPIQILRQKAEIGARLRYSDITPEIQTRLNHELKIIGDCGYATLFLVMEEIVSFTRQNGIPISSRGSAASSLVAHCLGITDPDPIRLDLYFERFLNPARATPPDIDTDLCSRRRDEVISYVYQRYGCERVAMVATVNRFRRRSALREMAKAYGLPAIEISKLVDHLPHRWFGPQLSDANKNEPYAELAKRYSSPRYQQIFQDASEILGFPRHLSIHPGGVVIAPGPINDLAPTQMATKGIAITQFDLGSIERLGLVKIDLLGIRGLSVLGDVAETVVAKNHFPNKQAALDVLETIPGVDPPTAELVRQGKTIGCFQIESPGMRSTLKAVQARCADDLMVALALYRPGPLSGGLKDAFVRRHKGQEPASYLHPSLEPLLEDTYGVILYQEQVLRIANELGGLSLSDADLLRRAMSHFDPGKQMITLKEKFISGALERNGVPEGIAERIWELMAAFAGYGFPKAHAASYAQVAWRSAWCKAHYPAVFMAAVLANWGGYYSQRVYITEARRLGLTIRPPLVNYARQEFSVRFIDDNEVLVMGLNQVRDLTRRTQTRILELRPFPSLTDLLIRVDPRPIEAENLVRSGALEDLGTIPTLLNQLQSGKWQKGQLPLFATRDESTEDWTLAQKVASQETILGASIAAHPLELYASQISEYQAATTIEAAENVGQRVRIAGMRQTWRRSSTSRGEYIYFMSLEDLQGMIRVVINGDTYQRYRAELASRGPYVLEGVVELDPSGGDPFIRAEKIWGVHADQ